MSEKYTPNYQPSDLLKMNPASGFAVSIEEAEQQAIANADKWMLARELNSLFARDDLDTRPHLEQLGFTNIQEADDLFYQVTPPAGWTKSTSGYWTIIEDETGIERGSQFYKGAFYDRRAHLSIK